jgi:hypothetical protein
MKKAFLIFGVVAVIGGFLLFLNHGKQNPITASDVPAADTHAPLSNAASSSNGSGQSESGKTAAAQANYQVGAAQSNSSVPDQRIKNEIEAQNVPLDFYGRVIDQDSNSLPGVTIDVRIRHWTTESFGSIPEERITDPDGRFDIHDATGDGFGIEGFAKPGYQLEPNTKRNYGPVGGSYTSPVIFKMWNTNSHEHLITGEKSFQIVPDGRAYFVDLTKGTIAETGSSDLKLWVKRPEQISYGQRYNWSCEADVLNGGLLAESDMGSSMYLAPIDGYTPSFQFEQTIGSGWSDTTGQRRFYIEFANGQEYGRLTIELMSYYNDQISGMIRLSYAINPSGSRVLY